MGRLLLSRFFFLYVHGHAVLLCYSCFGWLFGNHVFLGCRCRERALCCGAVVSRCARALLSRPSVTLCAHAMKAVVPHKHNWALGLPRDRDLRARSTQSFRCLASRESVPDNSGISLLTMFLPSPCAAPCHPVPSAPPLLSQSYMSASPHGAAHAGSPLSRDSSSRRTGSLRRTAKQLCHPIHRPLSSRWLYHSPSKRRRAWALSL